MDPYKIIDSYYSDSNELANLLLVHSEAVSNKALSMAQKHRELSLNEEFIYEAAMLHDIGIIKTNAPSIHCYGDYPYIAHGYLGADMLRELGLNAHALVCERHTGTGLSLSTIKENELPIPLRSMEPVSLEEEIICFADKFFTKSDVNKELSVEEARKSLARFGEKGILRFDKWCKRFL